MNTVGISVEVPGFVGEPELFFLNQVQVDGNRGSLNAILTPSLEKIFVRWYFTVAILIVSRARSPGWRAP